MPGATLSWFLTLTLPSSASQFMDFRPNAELTPAWPMHSRSVPILHDASADSRHTGPAPSINTPERSPRRVSSGAIFVVWHIASSAAYDLASPKVKLETLLPELAALKTKRCWPSTRRFFRGYIAVPPHSTFVNSSVRVGRSSESETPASPS
jgi:hypothetical protein